MTGVDNPADAEIYTFLVVQNPFLIYGSFSRLDWQSE
jgi:hypothetical protein